MPRPIPKRWIANPSAHQSQVAEGAATPGYWRASDFARYTRALAQQREDREAQARGRRRARYGRPRGGFIVTGRPTAPARRSRVSGRFIRSSWRPRVAPNLTVAHRDARDMGIQGIVRYELQPDGSVIMWVPEVTP